MTIPRRAFWAALCLALALVPTACESVKPKKLLPFEPRHLMLWKYYEASPELKAKVEDWTRKLESDNPEVRASAATSLLSTEHPVAIETLIQVLQQSEIPGAKIAVAKAFGFAEDDRAVAPMVALLDDPDPEVQKAASESLARIRTRKTLTRLAEVLQRPDAPLSFKVAAVQTLGAMRDQRAAEPLIPLLTTANGPLREAAKLALEKISNQSLGDDARKWQDWWEARKAKTREQWLEETVEKHEKTIARLEKENEALKTELAVQTVKALDGRADKRDPAPLLEGLKHAYPEVRVYAAKELGKTKSPAVVSALVEALLDKDARVRAAAAASLGELGDRGATSGLSAALRDEDASVREAAARSLGKLKDWGTADALVLLLGDGSEDVCAAAAEALGDIGDQRAVPSLIKALTHSSPKVREAAAGSLGKVRDPRAARPLIQALSDPNERVRWYAADSLGALGQAEAEDPLIAALADENPRVRESAAIALGKLGGVRAVPALTKLLKDADKRVAEQAAEALVRVAGEKFETLDAVATALYNSGDFKRAVLVLDKQLEKYSAAEEHRQAVRESRLRLAKSCQRLADWPKAIEAFEALLPLYPKDVDIRVSLAQCLKEARQLDRALQYHATWLQELPDEKTTWWQGRLDIVGEHLTQKNYAKVTELVDEFEKTSPDLGGPKLKAKFLELREKAKGGIR